MSWPVSVNDEIVTQGAAARLRLTDGTVITLQRNSHLRLESAASRIQVKMLSGSAIEDVKSSRSALGTTTTTTTTLSAAARSASAAPVADARAAAASPNDAVVYRMASSSSTSTGARLLMAPTAISSGTFYDGANKNADAPSGTRIVLPNGTILSVTATGNGGAFTIDKISVPVTGADGNPTYVETTNSSLVGATITAPPAGQTGGVTVTTSTGSVLSPTQLGTAVSTAVSTAVTEAIQSGEVPAGTVAPPASPVSVGTFAPAEVVSPPGS